MNPLYFATAMLICFANDNDALIPEKWAFEGLAILEESMVMANLVHRDFNDEIREFGDVVNAHRPAARTGRRKTDADSYTARDVSVTNVRVPLDQWFYDSFVIKDGESSKAFKDLVAVHLTPAVQNMARMVDRAVLGRCHEFTKTPQARAGRLLNMTSSNARDFVLEAREHLNTQKAFMDGRNLVLAPSAETALLKTDLFVAANQRGDGGSALENALLGRILGFDTYMAQNVNYIGVSGADVVTGTVTNALAANGSGSQAVSVASYITTPGEYAVVDGNDQPTYITADTDDATNTTAVTLNEANKYATSAGATITVYKKCAVQGAYAVGYSKEVIVDGHAANKGPQVGQLIAFGTGASRKVYTVIEATEDSTTQTSLLLDRPLEVALADNDDAFPGPAGSMNLAFHRESIALVSRPLALPDASLGVRAAVGVHNGVAMRVIMQYDSSLGGTRVNLDVLAGVAILDDDLGCLLLG
jgi:hypothetical protein